MQIGEKIKNLRLKMGLTQEELADRSDLTKGFISQLEHDLTSPSIDTLENLVGALGTNLSDFFLEQSPKQIVFTEEDAFSGSYDQLGMAMRWIVPDAQKNQMEPIILELQPGGKSKSYTPFEGECFGYVLEGRVLLHIDEEAHEVKAGDCFYYEADHSHWIENDEFVPAKVLWIETPPNF